MDSLLASLAPYPVFSRPPPGSAGAVCSVFQEELQWHFSNVIRLCRRPWTDILQFKGGYLKGKREDVLVQLLPFVRSR